MSYIESKRERERAFVESIHGDGEQTAPGLPAIRVSRYDPRPGPMLAYDDDDTEPGWRGPSYVLEDGASLFFPFLSEKDRP